jgi:hypothetical protein
MDGNTCKLKLLPHGGNTEVQRKSEGRVFRGLLKPENRVYAFTVRRSAAHFKRCLSGRSPLSH